MPQNTESADTLLFTYWEPLEVRWGDMDAYGHVNHAMYFTYLESARMNYFVELDLESFSKKKRYGPVLAGATCNFRRQVHHPATLLVGTRIGEIRTRSFVMEYVVLRVDDETTEIVADGTTAVVWVETATGKASALPDELRAAIEKREHQRTAPS